MSCSQICCKTSKVKVLSDHQKTAKEALSTKPSTLFGRLLRVLKQGAMGHRTRTYKQKSVSACQVGTSEGISV